MKFKNGDRVRVIENCDNAKRGMIGTVIDADGDAIEFDTYMGGHDCWGICENGYGQYVPEKNLEKITESKFKVGDIVKVKKDEKCCFAWAESMDKFVGNSYEIESIQYSTHYKQNAICLKETGGIRGWRFSESCLELVTETKLNKSLHIYQQGDTTTAILKDGKQTIKTEMVKRYFKDTDNFDIAVSKVLKKMGIVTENLKSNKVKEVKRRAKVGEWVKVVKADSFWRNEYKNGDILQIVERSAGDLMSAHAFYKDSPSKFLFDEEYVVLENYKPVEKIEKKPEFRPYLFCTKCNKVIGYIGEPNGFTDCDGTLFNVGDIVFDKVNNSVRVINTIPCGCSRYSGKCDLKIVKKFNEVANGEIVNTVKYVKEEL